MSVRYSSKRMLKPAGGPSGLPRLDLGSARFIRSPRRVFSVEEIMPVLQQEQSLSVTELNALLAGLMALKKGRRGARLPLDWTGVAGKVADACNDVVEL